MDNDGAVAVDGMQAYRDGSYKLANPTWGRERTGWKARQMIGLLEDHCVRPESILEVGCGTGLILTQIGDALGGSPALIGIDPSPDAPVDPGVLERIEFRRCLLSETDVTADLVMLLDVFEHVEDDIGLIREAAAHSNRWVAFHIPIEVCVLEVAAGLLGRSHSFVSHLHYYSDRTALIALKAAGLTNIVGVRYTPSGFEGPTRDRSSALNRLRRVLFKLSPKLTARWLGGVSLAVLARVDNTRR